MGSTYFQRLALNARYFPTALILLLGNTSAGFFDLLCYTLHVLLLLNSSQFCIFFSLETQT